jgi:hypothetical protein
MDAVRGIARPTIVIDSHDEILHFGLSGVATELFHHFAQLLWVDVPLPFAVEDIEGISQI